MRNALALPALLVGLNVSALAAQSIDPRTVLKTVFSENVEKEMALSAAPEHLRAGATVYVFRASGYAKVQTGTNGFTCFVNRDGFFYNSAAFKPTCWDAEGATSYVPVMLRVGELLAAGKLLDEIRTDIDAGFKGGKYNRPKRTGVAYMLAGDVNLDTSTGKILSQAYPSHYMIYAPGVTNGDLGYSREAAQANATLPFIFRSGAGGGELSYLIIAPQHR
ncbi:MAG TPA: hypothetical protein VJR92_12420 [Gemmatimonadaceae bacterium]|nr:hypothetical protein [Gemmatimonadaceae bacterium]